MRYETMIVVDSAVARADKAAVEATIEAIIKKCSGDNIDIESYGERKLAYQIGKHTRGVYFLVHFDMDGNDVPKLLREFKLNEEIFRYMVQLDHDAGLERRDLANPKIFNVDSTDSRSYFEKNDGSNRSGGGASRAAAQPRVASTEPTTEGAE